MIYNFLEKNNNLLTNALIFGEKKISYKELDNKSKKISKKIIDETSNIVIIYMPNSLEYVISYFSILFENKTVFPISPLSTKRELLESLTKTKSKTILTLLRYKNEMERIFKDSKVNLIFVDKELNKFDNQSYSEKEKYKDLKKNEVSLLLNTSGSTGKQKTIMLSPQNIWTNCNDWVEAALDIKLQGRVLVAVPACTSFGSIVITTCIMLGWTVIFMPSFYTSASLLNIIEQEKVTHLIGIGSMLNILASDIANLGPSSCKSLKFIGIGGNKAVPETMKILMNYFTKAGISPGYGITEATCMVSTIHPDISLKNKQLFMEKIESAGKPFSNSKVKILNSEKNKHLPGEIVINGDIVMKGYYGNLEETKNTITKEGLHTGDIGYFDNEDFLYIIGRKKNIIKSGGYTIFPEEVEEILLNNDLIKEAYVYGVPDLILDELISADIIPVNDSIRISEIERYCQKHLTSYKVPLKFNLVSNIIKTKNGKIKRKVFKINE